jgi:hypothetical protein
MKKNKGRTIIVGLMGALALLWLLGAGAAGAQEQVSGASVSADPFGLGDPYPARTWYAQYWNNRDFLGLPLMARLEPEIDYYWGTGSPAAGVILNDQWAARWTQTFYTPGGLHRIIARVDDAVRVYVDGQLVIDGWYDSAEHTLTKDLTLTPGAHTARVDYYDAANVALAVVDIEHIGSGGGGFYPNWKAEYFNNTTLSGQPVLVRDERQLNLEWGLASPAPGVVNADGFSARYTRPWQGAPGYYRLTLTSDDGSRLFINGVLVVDNWAVQGVTSRSVDWYFDGAPAQLRVDFFENNGGAKIALTESFLSGGGSGVTPVCPSPSGNTMVINAGGQVNLRSGPGTNYPTVGQLEPCETVTFLGYNQNVPGWVYVEDVYRQQGWVATQFLSVAPGLQIN